MSYDEFTRADELAVRERGICNAAKCGEFNMLRCCAEKGHSGDHCYVVDHENDYPHRKAERAKKARRSAGG